MPTIILCSGSAHTEFHLQPSIPHFEKAGYRVVPCPLLSAGDMDATTEAAIVHLQETTQKELQTGKDVCLVLHSAAGRLGAEVVNRILAQQRKPDEGKISRLIFVASFIEWEPVISYLVENNLVGIRAIGDIITSFSTQPKEAFFGNLTDEEAQPFVDALVPETAMEIDLSSDAWESLPKTYLLSEDDQTVSVELQEDCAKEYGMEVVRRKWPHSPFVGKPEEFAKTVHEVLRGA